MIIFRRRLLFWIIKEYVKRWRKIILISFVLGFIIFFILYLASGFFISKIPIGHKETLGVVGDYTLDSLPLFVLKDVSTGLTNLTDDDTPGPGLTRSYAVKNNDKTYEFKLKKGVYFSDGTLLTSNEVSYQFSDVKIEKPDRETVVFNLKEPYAPFLAKVSYPVFRKGYIGTGAYKIADFEISNTFIKKLVLSSVKNQYDLKIYKFYPTEQALKLAFVLGEVSKIVGITDTKYNKTNFTLFPGLSINKNTNYQKLVSLFYDYHDKVLSDKRLRQALSYGLPDTFKEGERSYYSYSPKAWYFETSVNEPRRDIAHAKLLASASSIASSSAALKIEIKTLSKYSTIAKEIAASWKDLDIETNIVTVNNLPDTFQIFLGDFNLSQDPDQYSLWHSNLNNNISHYNNLRIDKLLEKGRTTLNKDERRKIYADFQKYLLDDPPASFLYFPYEYEISR